jgi:hypothetical protein
MNNIDFNKIKYILSGCKTLDDAIMICNMFNFNKKDNDIIMSIINAMKFDNNIIDINSMLKYIKEVNDCKYKEDVYDILDNLFKKTNDPVQIRTLQRFTCLKQNKPHYITMKELREKNAEILISKRCPHCGHICSYTSDTTYTICGYTDNGYDWEGCGCDWCFKCDKILCKNWENDQLYLPINRSHDKKCCKKHASLHKKKYPDDYCQCPTSFETYF